MSNFWKKCRNVIRGVVVGVVLSSMAVFAGSPKAGFCAERAW